MDGFWRKIEVDIKEWRDSPSRKPLVLRGARQTGKTTLIKSYFSRGGEIGHGNKGSYEPLILPSVQTDP